MLVQAGVQLVKIITDKEMFKSSAVDPDPVPDLHV